MSRGLTNREKFFRLMNENEDLVYLVMHNYSPKYNCEYCGTEYESFPVRKKDFVQCERCGAPNDIQKLIHYGVKVNGQVYYLEKSRVGYTIKIR